MIKRLCITLTMFSFFFLLMGVRTQTVRAETWLKGEATIISANYEEDHFTLALEMNNTVYEGHMDYELSYEDYLFFHHNVGATIEIIYTLLEGNQITIHTWGSLK